MGVVNGVATVEKSLVAPQKASATQQPHSSADIADTPESRGSKGACVPGLGVSYSQRPQDGNDPGVHQQMSGYIKCGLSIH